MELKANFHTHTIFCDGTDTAEDMVKQAISLGFTGLGFSGHMDADIHMDIDAYMSEITRLQDKYSDQIEILRGIELDPSYDYDLSSRKYAEYWMGSTHFIDVPSDEPLAVDLSVDTLKFVANEYFHGDIYKMTRHYFDQEAKIYDRTGCTFVGHFDLISRFNDEARLFDESNPRYYEPALEAMEYLVSQDVPFEINCGAVNRGRKEEFYPNMFLLRHLKEFGAEILINSDAHQKELLNAKFPEAINAAKECGFDHINILTKKGTGKVHLESLGI